MDVAAKIASISRTEFMRSYNEKYLKALSAAYNGFMTFYEAQDIFRQINSVIHSHGIQSKLSQYTDLGLLERQLINKQPVWRVVPAIKEWIRVAESDAFVEGFKTS
jgi:uncharacterized membrane protein